MIAGDGRVLAALGLAVAIAVALIVTLLLLRVPRAWREPAARPAWVASLFALVGMLTLDVGVPLESVDSWFGGGNSWNLVQALSATFSFWFFYRAIQLITRPMATPPSPILLCLSVGLQAALFLAISGREGPPASFVADHLTQAACFGYLAVYMATIGCLGATAVVTLRSRSGAVFWIFRAGYVLVAASCAWHMIYLAVGHFELAPRPTLELLRQSFYLGFIPGVLLLAVGFSMVFFRSALRRFSPVWRVRSLRLSLLLTRLTEGSHGARLAVQALLDADPRSRACALSTAIYDSLIRDDAVLTDREENLVNVTTSQVLVHVGIARELAEMTGEMVQG